MTPPLPFWWDGEAMQVRKGFQRQADAAFCIGEGYRLIPFDDRSEVSHKHEFAWLREAWASLPEALAAQHPTPEHLRKWALIQAGYCDTTDYACMFKTEARRLAATLQQQTDDYAVVIVADTVVRVVKPKSQSMRAMGGKVFQASKTAIMEIIAGLIEVEPATLQRQQEAA